MLRRSLPKLALQPTLPMEHLILRAIGLGNNIFHLALSLIITVANDKDQMMICYLLIICFFLNGAYG